MPYKFNPFTSALDYYQVSSPGDVSGVPPTTPGAIAQWVDTIGTVIANSPGTFVQPGGALETNGFITQRQVTTDITVPSGYSWIAPELQLEPAGSITIESDGELIII